MDGNTYQLHLPDSLSGSANSNDLNLMLVGSLWQDMCLALHPSDFYFDVVFSRPKSSTADACENCTGYDKGIKFGTNEASIL